MLPESGELVEPGARGGVAAQNLAAERGTDGWDVSHALILPHWTTALDDGDGRRRWSAAIGDIAL
jgi:hypothetical protein